MERKVQSDGDTNLALAGTAGGFKIDALWRI